MVAEPDQGGTAQEFEHFTPDELFAIAHRAIALATRLDSIPCGGAAMKASLLRTIGHACNTLGIVTPDPNDGG